MLRFYQILFGRKICYACSIKIGKFSIFLKICCKVSKQVVNKNNNNSLLELFESYSWIRRLAATQNAKLGTFF